MYEGMQYVCDVHLFVCFVLMLGCMIFMCMGLSQHLCFRWKSKPWNNRAMSWRDIETMQNIEFQIIWLLDDITLHLLVYIIQRWIQRNAIVVDHVGWSTDLQSMHLYVYDLCVSHKWRFLAWISLELLVITRSFATGLNLWVHHVHVEHEPATVTGKQQKSPSNCPVHCCRWEIAAQYSYSIARLISCQR